MVIGGTQSTPRGARVIISIIGRRNVGKSSLLNAICGEEVAIVSSVAGTTTDTVVKNFELLPFGPVTFYDTAGLDDNAGSLGEKRVIGTTKVLLRTDLAILLTDNKGITSFEKETISHLKELDIPFIIVGNDFADAGTEKTFPKECDIVINAKEKKNISELRSLIIAKIPAFFKQEDTLLKGLINKKDKVALITPIDSSAPKKRLILPQVEVLREILDIKAKAIVAQEMDEDVLAIKPDFVITDSQKIISVASITPPTIPLTTFSVLFARAKGDLSSFVKGIDALHNLKDGDKVLISEGCSHHAQDDDIGRVKIPNAIKKNLGKEFEFTFYSGHDFPSDLASYALVIHCGACMLGKVEMLHRIRECKNKGVPITNYGLVLAFCGGYLERVLAPFCKELS